MHDCHCKAKAEARYNATVYTQMLRHRDPMETAQFLIRTVRYENVERAGTELARTPTFIPSRQ